MFQSLKVGQTVDQTSVKIGIFGGGQLARMLVLQAHRMGIEVHVLSGDPQDPAAQVTKNWHQGQTDQIKDLLKFCKAMDLVTFESEFIPADALKTLDQKYSKKLFPQASLLRTLQDRLTQKNLLTDHKIPTSPFIALSDKKDLMVAFGIFKTGVVVKKRLGGYDGKGTFVLKNKKDIEHFLKNNDLTTQQFICEKFIYFKRELAFQVARNPDGEILFLPLVEIHQTNHQLDWLQGPVKKTSQLTKLQKKISYLLKKIDYVGVIAFELFDLGRELIVNEIAPRVHNSGHYTTEALNIDQFSLHLMAGLNQFFPKLELKSPHFVMTNLIGQGSKKINLTEPMTGTLHWYGKTKNSPGRKLGHITYFEKKTPAKILRKALQERKRMKL